VVVAFTFGLVRGWDCFEEPCDLLVGSICFAIQDQDWYVDRTTPFAFHSQWELHSPFGRTINEMIAVAYRAFDWRGGLSYIFIVLEI
jgi:hypothetical protein